MHETPRACRQRIEDFLVQQNPREGDETRPESLADSLNIGAADTFLLPGMHRTRLTHATNNLQK